MSISSCITYSIKREGRRCMPDAKDVTFRRLKRQRERGQLIENQRRFLLQNKVDDNDDSSDKKHGGGLKRVHGKNALIYYSAYTHSASPTYFKWVHLTAREIHGNLSVVPGFIHSWLTTGRNYGRYQPQLLFYLNHPIQFVQVVGVVVNTEEWYERFWLFTIDDSSGYTIDVVCRKPDTKKADDEFQTMTSDEKEAHQELARLSHQLKEEVQIGAVLQVKGTITLFQRNRSANVMHYDTESHPPEITEATRQLALQRLSIVHDTNAEMALMASRTKFFNEVLSKPWRLHKKEQEKLYRKASGNADRVTRHTKRRVEKSRNIAQQELADARALVDEYEIEEKERAAAAEIAREAGIRLTHSQELPQRMTRAGSSEQDVANCCSREDAMPRGLDGGSRKSSTAIEQVPILESADITMSFGINEDERSALLKAAFNF